MHGNIGVAEQGGRALVSNSVHCHADAGSNKDLVAGNRNWLLDILQQRLRDRIQLRGSRVVDHQRKLITAEMCNSYS